jgi:G3E family GTPase
VHQRRSPTRSDPPHRLQTVNKQIAVIVNEFGEIIERIFLASIREAWDDIV